MNTICKRTLLIGIILLMFGVSVSSAISVDNKLPTVESEEDCGCNEVSDADIVILEKQLDSLKVYSSLILVLSKYNPELKELSEELSDNISTLTIMFEDLDFPILKIIICDLIFILAMSFVIIGLMIAAIGAFFTYNIYLPTIADIFFYIAYRVGSNGKVVWDFGINVAGCDFD